ncbi:MAG TPA: NAD-dependent epimerase/dehydratase family protein, partial [Chitinophagaceae bacterium]|nr:NAD-dependent epimerase/dehydratase family protein [Chitinophagaceae bacterium]
MKVLVTGATGFIGSYVVEALLRKGCSVMASARSEESARVKPWFGKVQFLPFDLRNPDGYEGAYAYFGHPDLLIHLAWEGLPNYKSLFHFEENLPRHYAFLKNMITGGLKDLTVTGTCFEYGFREGSLRESDPA